MNNIGHILKQRILVLDGAMGSMIERYAPDETTFQGEYYVQQKTSLKGYCDVLCITAPHIVSQIHKEYLDAGADIITTNTFNANAVSLADYNLQDSVAKINYEAARLACRHANHYTALTPDKPRYVAGSVGPTSLNCTINNPSNAGEYNQMVYNKLVTAYTTQMIALIDGGVDMLFVETICDLHNAQAAIQAAECAMKSTGRTLPIMLSITTTPSGTLLSGHTLDTFIASLQGKNIFSVGINCAYGAEAILPHLRTLSRIAPGYISAHPNAGLPDKYNTYTTTADDMATLMLPYIEEQLVNIVGGCCGTTPQLTALLCKAVKNKAPHTPHSINLP